MSIFLFYLILFIHLSICYLFLCLFFIQFYLMLSNLPICLPNLSVYLSIVLLTHLQTNSLMCQNRAFRNHVPGIFQIFSLGFSPGFPGVPRVFTPQAVAWPGISWSRSPGPRPCGCCSMTRRAVDRSW